MEPNPTNSYADLLARLTAAETRVLAIVSEMFAAARRRRPTADAWSADEIVDHLATTLESYRKRVDAALVDAKARGPKQREGLLHSRMGRWLTHSLRPGSKPISAPRVFRPRFSPTGESAAHDAVRRFRDSHAALRRWIETAATVETTKSKVSSPALFLLRFNLDDVITIHVLHLERHLAQLERTSEAVKHH